MDARCLHQEKELVGVRSFEPPGNASWVVKQICKVKEELQGINMKSWSSSRLYKEHLQANAIPWRG